MTTSHDRLIFKTKLTNYFYIHYCFFVMKNQISFFSIQWNFTVQRKDLGALTLVGPTTENLQPSTRPPGYTTPREPTMFF